MTQADYIGIGIGIAMGIVPWSADEPVKNLDLDLVLVLNVDAV